ncbi:hypothetical protein OUZ56_015985 [Daphnia magna]|uniref:Uncharacterized protein n=1 Tax=Daphnia magna TaxID=35525 RepID=A0ABR0APB2_9CRUS|nr:hypothetical protein OUZ56_015985 [Daphnia magna]
MTRLLFLLNISDSSSAPVLLIPDTPVLLIPDSTIFTDMCCSPAVLDKYLSGKVLRCQLKDLWLQRIMFQKNPTTLFK